VRSVVKLPNVVPRPVEPKFLPISPHLGTCCANRVLVTGEKLLVFDARARRSRRR
jgi:hypothetical protein